MKCGCTRFETDQLYFNSYLKDDTYDFLGIMPDFIIWSFIQFSTGNFLQHALTEDSSSTEECCSKPFELPQITSLSKKLCDQFLQY